jgi:hypothetical protein
MVVGSYSGGASKRRLVIPDYTLYYYACRWLTLRDAWDVCSYNSYVLRLLFAVNSVTEVDIPESHVRL